MNGNTDGSYDFTAIEITSGVGWLYAGSLSRGTIFPFSISYYPIPIPLFSLPVPGNFHLIYENNPNAALLSTALTTTATIVSLYDPQGRLYLEVQDAAGRVTGMSPSNITITEIPNSAYVEYRRNMAVILPYNINSFTFKIDAERASVAVENFFVAVQSIRNGDVASQKTYNSTISKGSVVRDQVSRAHR